MNKTSTRNAIAVSFLIMGLGTVLAVQAQSYPAMDDAQTLRAVTLLFRHGTVSPKYTAPKVNAEWPMGLRQLTALGIREMYDNGQALRRKYIDEMAFLSSKYQRAEIYVRGSNTDRSLQSAQLLMLGLFPLGTGPNPAIYGKSFAPAPARDLAFTPVPVHTVALANDWVLRPYTKKTNCKRYRTFLKTLPQTEAYRKLSDEYRDLLRLASSATGMYEHEAPNKILYSINEIYEVLTASAQHNFPLPPGLSEQALIKIRALSDWNYHQQFLGKSVGTLMGGGFLRELISNFAALVKDAARGRKFSVYAGHQRTMLGMEAALGLELKRTSGPLFSGRVPPLASYYAFELHESASGDWMVRLTFHSQDSEQVIPIPGCAKRTCTFANFAQLVADVVPRHWRKACGT